MPAKKQNRCYAGRYGDRYGRNFAAPAKKASETWTEYHDRLAAMTVEARRRGAVSAAAVLERRAGDVASKHKIVRTKARKSSKGPGTYPWAECIKDARARGYRDPAAVCGAIRAASRKRYPAYWKARHTKRNPSVATAKRETQAALSGAASSVVEGLSASSPRSRAEWFVSAAMYAGEGVALARASGCGSLMKEALSVATHVRHLIVESSEWKKNPHGKKPPVRGKKPSVRGKKPTRNAAAIKRRFMSLR